MSSVIAFNIVSHFEVLELETIHSCLIYFSLNTSQYKTLQHEWRLNKHGNNPLE